MIDPERLRALRNSVPIRRVAEELEIPRKRSEGQLRFLCPCCGEFNTAFHPRENLGRCFRCQRNFNPIDLVMAEEDVGFRIAVRWITRRFSAGR